ncbi:MAG: SDR family NAD(P)-dependent oxidoreductase [Dehalococcoidia bacterium]
MSDRVLAGRTAVVTGAGQGIGAAIAEELAGAGASIAVLDIDDQAAQAESERLNARGDRAEWFHTDVADPESVDRTIDAVVESFGRLDIVVNNAGVSHVGPHIQDTTDEIWNRSIAVMQTGPFNVMRSASRYLLPQRRGVVVNIASIRGFSPNPGRIAYCASKAAVLMMTRVVAAEWASFGVRVNAIAPGVMSTPMWKADVERGAIDEEAYLATVPMHRIGDPREVGRLVLFLCGDEVPYMTGATLTIDGALTSVPLG